MCVLRGEWGGGGGCRHNYAHCVHVCVLRGDGGVGGVMMHMHVGV